MTANPADLLKLSSKGRIAPGKDADLVLVEENSLRVHTVLARGQIMVQEGVPCKKGTFE